MKIILNNKAGLSNKYIRFIKWKLYALRDKFQHLIYAEIFVKKEGHKVPEYQVQVRLGIPGNDLILKRKSPDLWKMLNLISKDAHLSLARSKATFND